MVPSRVVSLMRPQPDSGGRQRGAGLFSYRKSFRFVRVPLGRTFFLL